ncbi:ABC transporter permease [Chiayiivirga flava]|uniref:Putative ABC transport system permease protein n=1 Tax=Chiayiivirga flava TaxID=659595 RepID=A0A7W8D7X0_9GAMM|nr:ABC transporter permease [Chiayiivirga flava]MBB5209564.1 putative ABC transport system permease protein [Chiayiivirga flava]
MFAYYLRLALKSLRRNPILTGLMVAAIALGIGASMTSLTVLRAMSGNPLPSKEGLVLRPQVDNWSPGRPYDEDGSPPNLLTYRDATNIVAAKQATYQAAMFPNVLTIEPENREIKPYMLEVLFTGGDFFPMFDTPFAFGEGWNAEQDEAAARVAVLSHDTNQRLFSGENSVGREIRLGGETFRVVGVLGPWAPTPRFYRISSGAFGGHEDLYVPFRNGIERELQSSDNNNCWADPGNGYKAWLDSECIWIDAWVQVGSASERARYSDFLASYVNEQKKLGRFERPLNNRLSSVAEWLEEQRVVPRDVRTQVWMSFAFLIVCLVNTIGLLLAKFLARAPEIGLRRAVGASKRQVFTQYLTEAGMVGVFGAVVGLVLTALGLAGLRVLYADTASGEMAQLEPGMIGITVAVALVASLLAGLYPTWKACQITPATQLKSN